MTIQGPPNWGQPQPPGYVPPGQIWYGTRPVSQQWQQQWQQPRQQQWQQQWQQPRQQWPAPSPQQSPLRPSKPRGSGRRVLVVIVGVIVSLILISAFLDGLSEFFGPGPTSTTTATAVTTRTTVRTTGASTTTTTSATTTTPTGEVYQNNDYRVPAINLTPPEIPSPETYAEATQLLRANRLYSQTVPSPTNCTAAALNPRTQSASQFEKGMNDFSACLMRVWDLTVQAASYELPRPQMVAYSTEINTACGKAETHNAFYCSGSQKIYFATDMYEVLPSAFSSYRYIAEMILAHEFGHAIQARTEILASGQAYETRESTESAANLWSRRLEAQADCLSGMFVSSVAKSQNLSDADRTRLLAVMKAIGDDTLSGNPSIDGEHGLARTRQAWFNAGFNSTAVGTCNSFTVAASEVR